MSYEVWGTPPGPEPKYCPLCDHESHSTNCELGKMQLRAFRAESEIAELKRQLKAANEQADIHRQWNLGYMKSNDAHRTALLASQARDVRLREALSELADLMEDVYTGYYHPDSFTNQTAREALALPHDDTAIKEYRDSVIGEFVGKFKRHVGGDGEFWLHELEYFFQNTKAP